MVVVTVRIRIRTGGSLYVCIGMFRDEVNRRSNERRDPDRDRDRGSPPFHSVEPPPPWGV